MGEADEMARFDGGKLDGGCRKCDAYTILDANHYGKGVHRWRVYHDPDCPVWLKHLGQL
ncbi:hypothetical protein GCM10009850_048010 [Nonomuraea monospora]|uniref:Uncharacterized protein n=1 Tax=Nonomuraea monospora TaxID=568818 RepID=A0ABN3CK50_9ACTN